MSASSPPQRELPIKTLIAFAIFMLLTPAILFISAGTLRWPMAWALSGFTILMTILSRAAMIRRHPDLAQERGSHRSVEGVKSWDRVLSAITGIYGNLAILIVAGLDHRFCWSPEFAAGAIPWIAWASALLGYAVSTWALVENRFFSAVVRIQTDRGHTVCDTGPYRYVRHPGYLGGILFFLAVPFILSTYWALVPAAVTTIIIVIRTVLEDKILQEELDGYKIYTQKTRYRLAPLIW